MMSFITYNFKAFFIKLHITPVHSLSYMFLNHLAKKKDIFIFILKDAESQDQSTSMSWLRVSRKFKGRVEGGIWVH